MPGRYVIDEEGIIRAAAVNADYTMRPEPAHRYGKLGSMNIPNEKNQCPETQCDNRMKKWTLPHAPINTKLLRKGALAACCPVNGRWEVAIAQTLALFVPSGAGEGAGGLCPLFPFHGEGPIYLGSQTVAYYRGQITSCIYLTWPAGVVAHFCLRRGRCSWIRTTITRRLPAWQGCQGTCRES
jgi:hypothetical protein